MNVLFLTQVFEVGQDPGSERHFFFCRYLAQHGHQVTALTSNVDYKRAAPKYPHQGWRRQVPIEGINVWYLYSYANFRGSFKKRFWYYLTYLFTTLFAGMMVENLDVIYAVSTPLTVGFLGYCLSRLKRIPFVFEVTDVWPDAAVAVGVVQNKALINAAHWLEMLCYHKATHIVALTKGIRDNIVGKGIATNKVTLVTNGVDPDLFSLSRITEEETSRIRQENQWADRFVCMYLGAHGPYNALWTIIEAAEVLRHDARFLFVTRKHVCSRWLRNRSSAMSVSYRPCPGPRRRPCCELPTCSCCPTGVASSTP